MSIRVAPDALSYLYSFSICLVSYILQWVSLQVILSPNYSLLWHSYFSSTFETEITPYHFYTIFSPENKSTEDDLPLKHVLWIRSYSTKLVAKCLKCFHSSLFDNTVSFPLKVFVLLQICLIYFFQKFYILHKVSLKKIYLLLYFYQIPHKCNLEI